MKPDVESRPYPPSPWSLVGTIYLSVWWTRPPAFPRDLPPNTHLLSPLGRALVGAVWVVYEAGGVLRYKEIASLALVRTPRGVAINIVDIWVDSVPAMSGGRELWGIPKEMGVFDTRARETFEAAVKEASGVPIASMTFKTRVRFPFALPFAAKIAQERCGLLTTLDLRVRGNVAIGRSDWEIPADSRLSYLPGRRPLLSLRVGDARIRFGNEAPRAERNGAG